MSQSLVERYISRACAAGKVAPDKFLTSRGRWAIDARFAVIYVLAKDHDWSASKTGRYLSRDHATILSALKRCEAMLQRKDGGFASIVAAVRKGKETVEFNLGRTVSVEGSNWDRQEIALVDKCVRQRKHTGHYLHLFPERSACAVQSKFKERRKVLNEPAPYPAPLPRTYDPEYHAEQSKRIACDELLRRHLETGAHWLHGQAAINAMRSVGLTPAVRMIG